MPRLLDLDPVADVAGVQHDAAHGGVVQQVVGAHLEVHVGAVDRCAGPDDHRVETGQSEHRLEPRRGGRGSTSGADVGDGAPDHRLRGEAEHPLERAARPHEPTVLVDDLHDVLGRRR